MDGTTYGAPARPAAAAPQPSYGTPAPSYGGGEIPAAAQDEVDDLPF